MSYIDVSIAGKHNEIRCKSQQVLPLSCRITEMNYLDNLQ